VEQTLSTNTLLREVLAAHSGGGMGGGRRVWTPYNVAQLDTDGAVSFYNGTAPGLTLRGGNKP